MATILQTDYAWPDVGIERGVIERRVIGSSTGPSTPAPAAEIEDLVARHDPRRS